MRSTGSSTASPSFLSPKRAGIIVSLLGTAVVLLLYSYWQLLSTSKASRPSPSEFASLQAAAMRARETPTEVTMPLFELSEALQGKDASSAESPESEETSAADFSVKVKVPFQHSSTVYGRGYSSVVVDVAGTLWVSQILQSPASMAVTAKRKKDKSQRGKAGARAAKNATTTTTAGPGPGPVPFSSSCAKGLTEDGFISAAFARRLRYTSADRSNDRAPMELTFRLFHLLRALPSSHQGSNALVFPPVTEGPGPAMPPEAAEKLDKRRSSSFRAPSTDFWPSMHIEDAQTICEGLFASEHAGYPTMPLELLERGGCNEGSFTPAEEASVLLDGPRQSGGNASTTTTTTFFAPSTSYFNPQGFTYLSQHEAYHLPGGIGAEGGGWGCSGPWNSSVFIGEIECGFVVIQPPRTSGSTESGFSVMSATGGLMSGLSSSSAAELLLAASASSNGKDKPFTVEHHDFLATAGYCDQRSCSGDEDPGAFVTDVLPRLLHLDAFLPVHVPLLWPSGEFPRQVLKLLQGGDSNSDNNGDSIFAGLLSKSRPIIFKPEGGLLRARRLFFYGSLQPEVGGGSAVTWLSQRMIVERIRERLHKDKKDREARKQEEAKRRGGSASKGDKKRIVVFGAVASDEGGAEGTTAKDNGEKDLVRALEEFFGKRSQWRKEEEGQRFDIRLLAFPAFPAFSASSLDETARMVFSSDIVIARSGSLGAALGVLFSAPRASLVEIGLRQTTAEELQTAAETERATASTGEEAREDDDPFPVPRYVCFTRNAGNNYWFSFPRSSQAAEDTGKGKTKAKTKAQAQAQGAIDVDKTVEIVRMILEQREKAEKRGKKKDEEKKKIG